MTCENAHLSAFRLVQSHQGEEGEGLQVHQAMEVPQHREEGEEVGELLAVQVGEHQAVLVEVEEEEGGHLLEVEGESRPVEGLQLVEKPTTYIKKKNIHTNRGVTKT